MPYQRGQLWVRRFRQQTERLCGALAALIAPPRAPDFTSRALEMLESIGWIAAHRFLFANLRVHLPAFLAPTARIAAWRWDSGVVLGRREAAHSNTILTSAYRLG
jgi:hypothetical protein